MRIFLFWLSLLLFLLYLSNFYDVVKQVIVRQLKVQFTVDMREILEDLLKAAAIGCSWAQQIPGSDSVRSDQDRSSVATRSSGHKSSTAASVSDHAALTNSSFMSGQSRANGWVDDSASARSSRSDGSNTLVSERTDLTPFGKRLLKMLLPRIWAAVSKVPSKIQMEVRRAFRILDDDNDGWIHVDQLEEVLKQVNGSHPFKYESEQIVKLLPDPEYVFAIFVYEVYFISSSITVAVACRAFVICEKDILHSLMRNPLSHIPLEHDLDSIVCGEFVATVYELMGLLPERTIEDLKHSASEATCTENKHSNGSAIKSSPVLEKKPDKASVRVAPAPEYRATEIEEKIASGGSNRRKNHHEDDELNDSDPDTDSGDDLYSHSPSRHKAKRKTQKEISDYINVLKQKETDHKKEEKDFREKDKQVKEKKKTVDYATRTRHHGLAGTKKQKQPKSYAFSIVVVDDTSQSTDFLHFVPMSFCTKHDPPLKLQMGRLTPEAYIDVPTEDQEEEDAEAVRNNSKKSKGKVAPT